MKESVTVQDTPPQLNQLTFTWNLINSQHHKHSRYLPITHAIRSESPDHPGTLGSAVRTLSVPAEMRLGCIPVFSSRGQQSAHSQCKTTNKQFKFFFFFSPFYIFFLFIKEKQKVLQITNDTKSQITSAYRAERENIHWYHTHSFKYFTFGGFFFVHFPPHHFHEWWNINTNTLTQRFTLNIYGFME